MLYKNNDYRLWTQPYFVTESWCADTLLYWSVLHVAECGWWWMESVAFCFSFKINIWAVGAVWKEMAALLINYKSISAPSLHMEIIKTSLFPSIGCINVSNWEVNVLIIVNADLITSSQQCQKPASVTLPVSHSCFITFVKSMFISNIWLQLVWLIQTIL